MGDPLIVRFPRHTSAFCSPLPHSMICQYPNKGVYNCAGCNQPIYNYDSKFKSGCGWPAFFEEIPGSVHRIEDRTFGMLRTEIVCNNCGGHLGHVFKGEGFGHPKDERHCVNSVSVKFDESAQPKKE